MPINADFFYQKAEEDFLNAKTTEDKIEKLQKMISASPKHKGSENLRAELNKRLVKLKRESEKEKAKKKGKSVGVKKEGDAQVTLFGFPQSGKSTLLSKLTNAKPRISEIPYTTNQPEIGTLDLEGLKVQVVDLPARIDDKEVLGIARASDFIVVVVTSLDQLITLNNFFKKENMMTGKTFILNKIDSISQEELKKFEKLPVIKVSSKTGQGLDILKQKIFESIQLIRVYTKEPGKKPSERPMIVRKDSTIKKMAEKIRKDYSERFLKAKIWGNSAKFNGQIVGISHILKDKDIVELYLKW
ncbi:MAG: 50S ribosome-binding GTPase [Nanoarchaeota archaeon]|nr:50S ribosome-binding GTPase [Nanoarchaeota archaeon]